jgi:hypothetical protein
VKNNPEKRIHVARFYDKYIKLLRRLGLDEKTPDGSAYRLHPHIFRKWYRTTLESAGVNKLLIDLWLGHNSGVEKLYYLPPPEVIKQEFDKADRVLRIFGRPAEPLQAVEYQEQIRLLWSALLDIATAVEKENPRLLKKLENLGTHYARAASPEGVFTAMLLRRDLLRRQP